MNSKLVCIKPGGDMRKLLINHSSWGSQVFMTGKFHEKIVFITVFVVSQLVECSWVLLELFIKRIFPFTRSTETIWEPGFWRAVRFRTCGLKRKWHIVCRSKKTRECVIRFIYRINGIDWRPVDTFQFRPECWHSCWVNKTYKSLLAWWLNNHFQVGNLKNWEVIR